MLDDKPAQGQLAFVHRTAETSKDALKQQRPKKQNRRKLAIENHCLLARVDGLTRAEIAVKTELPEKTVCPLVNQMLKDGILVEPGTRRATPTGSMAKVVVLSRYARASQ